MTDSARILVVDNYDSFVYTIVGYLKTLGATIDVVRNDAIDPAAPGVLDGYDGVLISPGPGAPAESGASEDMIRLCAATGVPMFGVCLGLQALAEVYGCTVDRSSPSLPCPTRDRPIHCSQSIVMVVRLLGSYPLSQWSHDRCRVSTRQP